MHTHTHTHTHTHRSYRIWDEILQHSVLRDQLAMTVSSIHTLIHTHSPYDCVVCVLMCFSSSLSYSVFHWQATIMGPVSRR